jgi:TPP-dependent indolepyruvate ferredoxin oxidoreductase alpha subunit
MPQTTCRSRRVFGGHVLFMWLELLRRLHRRLQDERRGARPPSNRSRHGVHVMEKEEAEDRITAQLVEILNERKKVSDAAVHMESAWMDALQCVEPLFPTGYNVPVLDTKVSTLMKSAEKLLIAEDKIRDLEKKLRELGRELCDEKLRTAAVKKELNDVPRNVLKRMDALRKLSAATGKELTALSFKSGGRVPVRGEEEELEVWVRRQLVEVKQMRAHVATLCRFCNRVMGYKYCSNGHVPFAVVWRSTCMVDACIGLHARISFLAHEVNGRSCLF